MTITITGEITNAAGYPDNRPWTITASTYQDGVGGVITTRSSQSLYPVAGMLSFEVEPGITAWILTPDQMRYLVRMPEEDADLWAVIEAGIAYPPSTSQDMLNAAIVAALPPLVAFELQEQTGDAIADYIATLGITFTDEGEGEGYFSVGGVPVSGTLVPPAATWSGIAAKPTSTVAAIDRAVSRVIDVRDVGVVGDGTSRPLSGLYGSLEAAQVDYPAAFDLDNELDWAAIQSAVDANPGATFLVHDSLHVITNNPIVPTDFSEFVVDGVIENVWPRNTPSAAEQRSFVFRMGNMHPYVLKTSNDEAWDTYALSDTAEGDRTITVADPTGLSLEVGDKIIVRSNTGEAAVGSGSIFDFVQPNKVVSYDSGTGEIELELPMGETVAAAASLTGPMLCVNAGTDPSNDLPWRFLDGFRLTGRGKLIGLSVGHRMGMWRGHVDIEADTQVLLSAQTCVKSYFNVRGHWTDRCLELKFAAWENDIVIDGIYKPDAEVTPSTSITIGEQATGNDIKIRCFRGAEHAENNSIFEDAGIRTRCRAELFDYSTGGVAMVIYLKSTNHTLRPPTDGEYDFYIRTSGTKTRYMRVGASVSSAHPTRHRWNMNARTSGTTTYAELIDANGGDCVRGTVIGDATRCLMGSSAIEAPRNAPVLAGTINGAPTYTAGTSTLVGTYTLTGVVEGDRVDAALQVLNDPSSGTFGDLAVSAHVSADDTVRVYVTNLSSTDVVMPSGNVYQVHLSWSRYKI